ncbi:MAG: hypothetical protein ACFE0I_08125 [Elainellaceae cyanobacterium]
MKYFFLSDGWMIGRIWEFGGIWDELAWRRKPEIQRLSLYMLENHEKLWLYRVEDAVLMVEVKAGPGIPQELGKSPIGQVVLKRLIGADQVIELLCSAERILSMNEE